MDPTPTPIRALIIGDEPLTGQCVEIAVDHGIEVVAIATTHPRVEAVGDRLEVPVVASDGDLATGLRDISFDVLLSIANLRIVPDHLLERADLALNFHDGPLPDLVGLNVTSWALLRGHETHAISWHHMSSEVDRGELALVRAFAIDEDDTAFSLNARCYDAALGSFPEIARAIVGGDVVRAPQPNRDSSVFLRVDRPGRIVDPTAATAIEIDRLVRALDLGGLSANRVGVPLVRIGETWVTAHSSRVVRDAGPSASATAPGTILRAEGDRLHVRAIDGDIDVALRALSGSALDTGTLLTEAGLAVGDRLAPAEPDLAAGFADFDRRAARHESAWANRLARLEPISTIASTPDLSVGGSGTDGGPEWIDAGTIDVGSVDEAVAAAALALARSVGADVAHMAVLGDRGAADDLAALGHLVHAPIAELRVDQADSTALLDAVRAELAATSELGPFASDLVGRRPGLSQPEAPVLLQIGEAGDADRPDASVLLWLVVSDGELRLRHRRHVDAASAHRWVERIEVALASLRCGVPPVDIDVVTPGDHLIVDDLNDTGLDVDQEATIDALIWRRAAREPDAPMLTWGGTTLSGAELIARSERLAQRLRAVGAGPGVRVGIAAPRSVELVVSVLATLRIGAAYVPLDPTYPSDRLQHMVSDSGLTVLLAVGDTPVDVDGIAVLDPTDIDDGHPSDLSSPAHGGADLAYVIYTSGSTGRPKGVMLEHRNVVNFFAAMDEVIDHDPAGVWLAVTSLSFDISVLELLWTLARGFHVVLKSDSGVRSAVARPASRPARPVTMSLFYFAAGDAAAGVDGYRLLLAGARFADASGFEAVWTPERHFHEFGGAYPNPSVVGAAVAATTSRVAIRAGSVVLPLHSPVRVAEEWSVVDNLSGGRVGISFAPGWQPNDFVLNPAEFGRARDHLPHLIDTVRSLWRGDAVDLVGHDGETVPTTTLPRPVQDELPVWLTSAGSPATFERAGALGLNVLTHLLGQSIEELDTNIGRYREAWDAAGHEGEGRVTLMLHTYLDADRETAIDVAREPMKAYLGTAVGLIRNMASSFPTFAGSGADDDTAFDSLSDDEMDQLLEMAADRYLRTSGLFGTPDDAADVIERVAAVGVDEVACLIDFGVDTDLVIESFDRLVSTRLLVEERTGRSATDAATAKSHDDGRPGDTVAELVARHGVTHLQCTPSLAAMLVADPDDRRALGSIGHLMLGGEALPVALAEQLRGLLPGRFTNMYGPTETTIWSLVHEIESVDRASIPIGRPIANNTVHVLDDAGRPLPVGAFGELHIGGLGVARGYHDRPELTAERFVDRGDAGRTYATGDVVRIDHSGVVEFAGRSDAQLKIRGHRIELGEIESVLDRHPGVVQSVVVPRGDALDPVLVAFVVTSEEVDPDRLRTHAATELPSVMIPSIVRVVDGLPLTPNGKVDRNALPHDVAPAEALVSSASGGPGGDESETLVASLWSSALGRPVGLDDNFFEIGGHSLLAVRVFRQLEERFSGSVALTDVFRYPTARSLGAHLRDRSADAATFDSGSSTDAAANDRRSDAGSERGARRRRALARRGGSGS